jgi:hypothetical protein
MSAETRTTSSTGGQKGVKIERFDLIPVGPLTALAAHFGRGALKYDDNQWRKGYEWSKSYQAKQRHDNLFWAGFDYDVCENDPEGCAHVDQHGEPFEGSKTENGSSCYNHTGSHHLDASNWHGFVLREFTIAHPEHDDRYRPKAETVSASPERQRALESYAFLIRFGAGIDVDDPVVVGDHEFDSDVCFTFSTFDAYRQAATQAVNDALNRRD